MSQITLKGITKKYGEKTVVDHVDLDMENGSLVSILGPSGCGKTTILRMIAGFEVPDGGDVLFDGQSVAKVPVSKRNIGMVFQSYALFPHMTVAQNVAYGLEQRDIPKSEIPARVHEALATVHMEEFADRKPKQLSGGQQQRVALARALVIRPKVLLLDECLSALDKKLRVEMQVELRRILEESHVTTFFVTHDQEEAMTLSDKIVVMSRGKIEQMGTPREVYEKPVNRFVADFLGKANFFDGVVETAEGSLLTIRTAEGTVTVPGAGALAGETVSYALRPEKIRLWKKGEAPADLTTLEGTVESVTYSGNLMSCVIRCGAMALRAEMGGADSAAVIQRGDAVAVSWSADAMVRLELPAEEPEPKQ